MIDAEKLRIITKEGSIKKEKTILEKINDFIEYVEKEIKYKASNGFYSAKIDPINFDKNLIDTKIINEIRKKLENFGYKVEMDYISDDIYISWYNS